MSTIVDSIDPGFSSSIQGILDLSVMQRLLDDTSVDFLPSLIEVFETESVQRVENIQTHLTDKNMPALTIEAHSLKGTSATFGAEKLRSISERIESSAASGDALTVEELAPMLPGLLTEVLEALKKFSSMLVR